MQNDDYQSAEQLEEAREHQQRLIDGATRSLQARYDELYAWWEQRGRVIKELEAVIARLRLKD